MSAGFIKLHRKMIEWEWYQDANVFRLFVHFILKANHKDKKWQGIIIKRGSFITGYDVLSKELGLTKRQIRTAITKLKTTGEVSHQPNNRFSVVTLTNYDDYQVRELIESKAKSLHKSGRGHSEVTQATPTKNDKNEKKDTLSRETSEFGNISVISPFTNKPQPPTAELVSNLAQKENLNLNNFFNHYESNGWMVGVNPMENWIAAARKWSANENEKTKKNINQDEINWNSTGWSKPHAEFS